MTDLPPDSLAARFARRVAERDNPPPVVLSHEPAAVEARLQAWLLGTHQLRDPRARLRLGKMLLALMEAPECSSAQLGAAAGQQQRAAARHLAHLYQLGLTDWEYRGLVRYHRLLPAAEDALLRVVAGDSSAV